MGMTHTIRVIDFETTGMEPGAEVVQVGICDLTQDGERWFVRRNDAWLCRVEAVPPEARAVHHIWAEDVAQADPFNPETLWVGEFAIVAAHNAEFEAQFWGKCPCPVLCTYKAALRVWPEAPGHSNGVLRYWLEDQGLIAPERRRTMPPHQGGPDAYVTAHILQALLQRVTARQMVAWTREPRLFPKCPIGKFRGKPWPEVEGGFLGWMLKQSDMEADLKWNAQRELDRRKGAGK
jgi:exodeoxyribonuclease X